MIRVPFKQVDVFTDQPFRGNPVAVILAADALSREQMQHIARWTNLSETTFVLQPRTPEASYRLRIFTPMSELPFAGHPSVGTAHALLESGLLSSGSGELVQECEAGLLPVRVLGSKDQRTIALRSPAAQRRQVDDQGLLTAALADWPIGDLAPVLYDNGPHWWLVELRDEEAVRSLRPDLQAVAALCRTTGAVGLAVFAAANAGQDYQRVVRAFCPADGIPEDPVTGSANASMGAYLRDVGQLKRGDRYVASQGRELQRDGRVEVSIEADGVWIGGQAVTVVDGTLSAGLGKQAR
ncbi:PhzF family phenazine biosynthesis protein [Pseudomarimonas arenosa]|uniref:PhzF family phenazine biosynthesis protein n=1 Tax=Pseudomarimonas arenosa TaxID=2774145 RepID=A0AAW3ZIJ3_9GAMM|nr:PhzF family phenazine biosynthesis protein [Pseudomarimonas arenosa]MBD8524291.1 PhzF family phenazine biosynthesis protein [Pseudomarimonas arenosa]